MPIAAQFAARLRLQGMTLIPSAAQRQHFALLRAVEQVDEILHANEAGPAVFLGDAALRECDAEGAGELPSVRRRGADIARLAGLHDIMQRFERLSIGVSWS
jgi:hypothetical protein